MSKFFRQASKKAPDESTGDSSPTSAGHTAMGMEFKEAKELWESYYLRNEISYSKFTERFLQLFDKSSNIIPAEFRGHSSEILVHVCQQFLIHIWVEYGTHTLEAEDFLLRSKLKGASSKDFSVTLKNVFTEKFALSKEFHANRSQLLLSIHLVSLVSKWSHNRDFIANHFGSNFFQLLIETIRVLISQLEDQIVLWSDYGNKLKELKGEALGSAAGGVMDASHNELRSDGMFLISSLVGLVQACGHVCGSAGFNVAHYSVGALSAQPWDVSDFQNVNVDLFLNYDHILSDIEPAVPRVNTSTAAEVSPSSPKGSRGPASTGAAAAATAAPPAFKTTDKMYSEVVQVLVVLLRKLFYFSKSACQFEEESRKVAMAASSSAGSGSGESSAASAASAASAGAATCSSCILLNGGRNNTCRLILALQCEVLHTLSNCLSSRPAAYSQFRICDGPAIVQSHLTASDVSGLLTSRDSADCDFIFQRTMLVLLCHEVCIVAGFKAPKLEFKEAITDMQHTISGLSHTIKWLVEKLTLEIEQSGYYEKAVDSPSMMHLLKKYSIECMCPGKLTSSLPVTDLYPWNVSSTAEGHSDYVNQHAADLKSMNQFLHSAALSNVFGAYWNKRTSENSSPEGGGVSAVNTVKGTVGSPTTVKNALHTLFEHDKSVICSVLQSARINSPLHAYRVKDAAHSSPSNAHSDVFILSPLMSFRTCEMISHLFMILYKLSWIFQDNQFLPPDSLVFIKDIMKLVVKTIHGVKESDGSNVFQLYFLLYFARCVKKSPQYTILSCRSENIWRSLLKINKIFGSEERVNSRLSKNKLYKVSRLAPDPSLVSVASSASLAGGDAPSSSGSSSSHTDKGHDVSAYKVSWSTANAIKKMSNRSTAVTDITPLHGSSNSLEAINDEAGHTSNTNSANTAGGEVKSEPLKGSVSFSGVPSDEEEAAKAVTLTNEFMSSFLKVVLKDMILELLWLYCSCNYLLLTANQTPSADGRLPTAYSSTNDSEAMELLDALSGTSGDDSVLMVMRWFNNLLDFHRSHSMLSSLWPSVIKKCLSLCKFHLDSMNSTAQASSSTTVTENNIHQRPLFWPARAGVIQLINKIMFAGVSTSWVDVFIPINNFNDKDRLSSRNNTNNSDGGGGGSSSNPVSGPALQPKVSMAANSTPVVDETYFVPSSVTGGAATPGAGSNLLSALIAPISISNVNTSHSAGPGLSPPAKHIKHVVILRLILDPLCRDFALSIIVKILCECSKILAIQSRQESSVSGGLPIHPTIYEALGHDILKGLFNTIKNAPQQPEYNDGLGAVTHTLQALTVFLRNPALLFEDSLHSAVNTLEHADFQRVFTRYGTTSPQHVMFGWKHGRGNVFRDLIACLEASFRPSSSGSLAWRWTDERKAMIVRRALSFMTALMIGNDNNKEIFKQQMMQRKKRKSLSSSFALQAGLAPLFKYHDFIAIILSGFDDKQNSVSPETIMILFEMMLDGLPLYVREGLVHNAQFQQSLSLPAHGLFEEELDVPRIENLTVIPLLLNVVSYCDEPLQNCILETLHNLIGGNGAAALINLSKCTAIQPPVLEMILDIFPQLTPNVQVRSVKLLQAIGKRTISVAQLKRMFRLMQLKDGCRPVYTWSLLDAIEGMILDAEVPKYYLFFQGKDSGLRLPSFRRWPATSGYSFSTWFCIDNNQSKTSSVSHRNTPEQSVSVDSRFTSRSDSSADRKYQPRLLSFRQENGLGLEVFFKPVDITSPEAATASFHVMVTVFSGSKGTPPSTHCVGSVAKNSGTGLTWHHLAFAHTASSFRTKSELVVLLDGQLCKHPVSFPRFNDEVKFPTIGDVGPLPFKDESINTTFLGQISAIYFFDEAISESYLRGIYSLGPTYSQLFSDREGVYRSNGSTHQSNEKVTSKALDGTLTSHIMLAYNPGVRKGNFFIDNSPDQNSSRWKPSGFLGEKFYDEPCEVASSSTSSSRNKSDGDNTVKSMNARRLEGTYICTTKDMRDSLDCLGGIKVLLPLFTQLSLPVALDVSFFSSTPQSREKENQKLYVKILQVFFTLLRGTAENFRLMNESGFSLLAYFMDTLSPKFISLEILDALIKHCDDLSDNQEWQNDFIEHIFCNFKLWIFTTYEIQRKLMNYLLSLAGSNVGRAYKVIQVRRLFDSLYMLYSSSAIQRMQTGSKSRSEETFLPKQWAQYYTLSGSELGDIRSSIVQMIYIIMSSAPETLEEEVYYLMNYIANESLPLYKVEGLQLLLRMINPEKAEIGNKILTQFCSKKYVYKLLHLHCHPRAKVRLYATICLCSVVQLALMLGKLPSAPLVLDKILPVESAMTTALNPSASVSNFEAMERGAMEPFTPGGVSSLSVQASSSSMPTPQRWPAGDVERAANPLAGGGSSSSQPQQESDVFESLGMPMKSLTSYFLWMQEQLKNEMMRDKFVNETTDKQSYIIFTAMQLTMLGHSCKYLINDVEQILSNRTATRSNPGTPFAAANPASDSYDDIRESLSSELGDRPSFFAKDAKGLIEDEVEINFECSRICIPMIMPALLEFVRHVGDAKRRIQLIIRLKNCMYGFENMDTILSIPGWQASIMLVLAQEQNRLIEMENEPVETRSKRHNKDISNIRNVLDIILNIISDIHIHAVRFGAPSISFFGIVKPCDVNDIQYHKISTRELLEVMKKDNRKVGCTVLKETVSCLRCYATQGEIDAQITGLELLQSTVDALQRESDTIINSLLDPMELNIRRKLLELNLWLISAFILEFITLPPTQPARASNRLSMSSPTSGDNLTAAIINSGGGNNNNNYRLSTKFAVSRRASTSSDPAEVTKVRGHSEDVTTNTTNSTTAEISSNSNDSINSIDALDKLKIVQPERSYPQSAEKVSGASVAAKRRSSIGANVATTLTAVDYMEADLMSLLKDKKAADGPPVNQYGARVWRLVESLLNLLGPMENFNNSWFNTILTDRLKAGMKVGIRLGRTVATQMQESVDMMINQHAASSASAMLSPLKAAQSSSSKNTSSKVNTKDSSLNRAIDAVFWIILRVLLKIFIEGGKEELEVDEQSSAIKAIKRLLTFMEWAKEGSRDYYDVESMFIITKLTEAVRSSNQPPTSVWTKQALSIVASKLIVQKQNIINKLTALAASEKPSSSSFSSSVTDSPSGSRYDFILLLQRPSVGGAEERLSESEIGSTSLKAASKTSLSAAPINAEIQNRVFALCDDSSEATSIIALETIRMALQLPDDGKFTWQLWNAGMEPILRETQRNEEAMMSSKLTDLGLHRHSQEMASVIEMQKHYEAQCFSSISNKVDESVSKVMQLENKHLREASKFEEQTRKKFAAHWNSINEELANERGPWGVGAEAHLTDVLWTVDPCEDNARMKPKLGKNSHGTRYLRDFLLANAAISENQPLPANSSNNDNSNGSSGNMTPAAPVATAITEMAKNLTKGEDVTSADNTGGARALGEELMAEDSGGDSMTSEQTNPLLWMDLRKYQGPSTKDIQVDEESDEEIQEFMDNDSVPEVDTKKQDTAAASAGASATGPVAEGEKVLFHANCEVITASSNSTNMPSFGYLEITKTKITFTRAGEAMSSPSMSGKNRVKRQESVACESLWACQPFPSTTWSTSEIVNIHQRYYQLRFVAVEIFTTSRKTVFFNLFEQKLASNCQLVLRRDVKPPYMAPFIGKRPATIVQKSTAPNSLLNLTTAWATREISNFDYLMQLNTIAGRTYNDLGQYPVFPWILADYSSDALDLRNPATFRDLSWPMGAQDVKQRQVIQTKYADLKSMYVVDEEEDNSGGFAAPASMPPFHYGTHYSVAGFVLWFLMRLEPYTSLHVQLQDGRIDRPDRLFDSLEAAWKGCTSNPSDVKELIPEMFYCPEVLKNVNGVDFGITQTGKKIDDILLPPWAKDPYDFIFKHREALESEYVSLNLHNWIDLIFGYKQRPPHLPGGDEAAVEFCNVYFHLTYENAVDLETLRTTNAALYQQYVCQISEFGQTPCQLFTKPHVARLPLNQVDIIWPIASVIRGVHTLASQDEMPVQPRKIICFKEFKVSVWPLIYIAEGSDRLITVDSTRILGYHSWQILSPDVVPPFKLKLDHAAVELARGQTSISSLLRVPNYNSSSSARDRRIGVPFAPSQSISSSASSSRISSDPKETQWRPVKIRSYEKEEKQLRKTSSSYQQMVGGSGGNTTGRQFNTPNNSVQSTPVAAKRKGMPAGGHDKEGLILASQQSISSAAATTSTPAAGSSGKFSTRLRSESELPESSSSVGGGQRRPVSSLQQSTYKNSSSVLDDHLSSKLFAYLPESKLLFSAGHWDHSFKVTAAESGKLIQSVVQHSDVITCLATVKDFGQTWLVTGSRDCTLMVWEILPDKEVPLGSQPLHILYGHDDAVTCVAISAELDIVVSGSEDGTIIIHNLRDGMYVRSIVDSVKDNRGLGLMDWEGGERERAISIDETHEPAEGSTPSTPKLFHSSSAASTPSISRTTSASSTLSAGGGGGGANVPHRKITWIGLSKENYLITYSADDQTLCTYSLNGHRIASHVVPEALYAFLISEDGKVLITGGSSCLVVFRWIHNLELANDGPRQGLEAALDGSMDENVIPPFASPIRSLYLTKMERHLLVGLESGELRILAQDSDYLRQRLQRKLIEIGIL